MEEHEERFEFYLRQLRNELGGGRIEGTCVSPEDELGDQFFGLQINVGGTRKLLWFLSDDEGNGPGGFEIAPLYPERVK